MSVDNKLCISIKILEKDDIDEVDIVAQQAYGTHHWSKDAFYSELQNKLAKYFVAKINDKVVGFAGFWSIIDEAHITTIAVSPEFKRRHIGETLLKSILDECYEQKVKYLTLEVRESNIPAISMYEKYGFQSFGVRKGYYQDNNENALIMWTENIFWDKFKNKYNDNILKLKESISIND